jgi:TonB family protein
VQIRVPRLSAPFVAAPTPVPPKLTISESDVSVPAAPSAGLPNAPAPPRPSVLEGQQQLADLRVPRMPNLVAVGVAPPPPPVRIEIPRGNRAGEFAVSPEGEELSPSRSGQAGKGDHPGEAPPLTNLAEAADLRVPNLSIAGEKTDLPPAPLPVVSEAPEARVEPRVDLRSTIAPPEGDLRTLMARAVRPSFPEMTRGKSVDTEPAVFGDRRVYTVYINMPNLASGAGSWILRFAERDGEGSTGEEISSPVALKKVDPKYAPGAIRERVEGTVTLAAQILRNGKVTSVKVVQGLDPRLDLSAVQALTLWQFEPARKKGVPIDLEVLVQIPFRLPAF